MPYSTENEFPRRSLYATCGKRFFDAVAALAGLILLAPLLALIALLIRLDSAGPAFFLQLRSGQFGKPFRIIKFRSMRSSSSKSRSLLTAANDSRITRVGRWLRKTKVDELPQLFNVLLGDMSLIGPRPEVLKYTTLYSRRQQQVLVAKPGITGPAALAYVDEEQLLAEQSDAEDYYVHRLMPAKIEIDLAYCGNISFRNDLLLLAATLAKVFGMRRTAKASVIVQGAVTDR